MSALFKKVGSEVTAKMIDHSIVLTTRRGVAQGNKGEILIEDGRERHIYNADHFLRTHRPVNQEALELVEKIGGR